MHSPLVAHQPVPPIWICSDGQRPTTRGYPRTVDETKQSKRHINLRSVAIGRTADKYVFFLVIIEILRKRERERERERKINTNGINAKMRFLAQTKGQREKEGKGRGGKGERKGKLEMKL